MMRLALVLMAVISMAAGAWGQQGSLMNQRDALAVYKRAIDLMESTAIAAPDLARAAAPVLENARQTRAALERVNTQPGGPTYIFLKTVRAYLAVSDSVTKPYPMQEEVRKQYTELRDIEARLDVHLRALMDQKETQIRPPDRDNLRRYAEANAKLPPPQAGRGRVVFFGDSITDSWRLNEYFPERDFVNRGISGQVTGEMLGRMTQDVIDLKPSAMVILAGTNDLARGVPVKAIEDNLSMIAQLAKANGIKVIMASILPVSDYHKDTDPRFEMTKLRPSAAIKELNSWMQSQSRMNNFIYCNYFEKMVDSAGMLQAGLADDGLHPNPAGYRVMGPIAQGCIDQAVAPPPAAVQPQKGRFRLPFGGPKPAEPPAPKVDPPK